LVLLLIFFKNRRIKLKTRIILPLLLALLTANCSQKKDDNSLRNLLILGILSQSKSETVNFTPGVAVRQKIEATQGQTIKYSIAQASATTSSILSRNTALSNRVTTSLIDSDNIEVYTTITVPGLTSEISYTPPKSGTYTVSMVPNGSGSVSTTLSGATASNTFASENSSANALLGKRQYAISGGFLQGVLAVINIEKVTSIGSDGKPVKTKITDAVVTLTVGTSVSNISYSSSFTPYEFLGGGYFSNINGGISGKKVSLKITHPTLTDLVFEKEMPITPTYVSNVIVNGLSANLGSGQTLTIDKTQSIPITWTNATGTDKPDTVQINIVAETAGNGLFLYIPASLGTYTVPKELLSILTSTSSSDNCIGINGGAGSRFISDPNFFIGLDATGKPVQSGISVIQFNMTNQLVPNTGFFCETNTINPLSTTSTKYSTSGVPLLVVK
jgi:hypothetical protein